MPFTATPNSSAVGGVIVEQNIDSSATFTAAINAGGSVYFRKRGQATRTNSDMSGKNIRFILTYFTTE